MLQDLSNISTASSHLCKANNKHKLTACFPSCWGYQPILRSPELRAGGRSTSATAFLQNKRGSAGWSNSHQPTLLAITGVLAHDKAQDAVCSLKVSLFTYSQAHPQPHVHAHTRTRAHAQSDLLVSRDKTGKTGCQVNNPQLVDV